MAIPRNYSSCTVAAAIVTTVEFISHSTGVEAACTDGFVSL